MNSFVSVIRKDPGHEKWFDGDGKLHRESGPALIWPHGEVYYDHGQIHRENGPAITCRTYSGKLLWQEWRQHDKLHRENEPAVIWGDGQLEYWVHGHYLHC